MVEIKKMSGSEKIEIIGKELYGDKFSIKDLKISNIYKQVYDKLVFGIYNEMDKGFLITGSIGVGKSAMMKVIQRLFKDTQRRFKWVSGYELRDLSECMTIREIKALYGSNLKCDLYIDDIGISVEVNRFGNNVNIISEIIMERYDLFVNSGYRTHLSSNVIATMIKNDKNTPTLENIYGLRVLDRIKEMCDLIIWNGESLRK